MEMKSLALLLCGVSPLYAAQPVKTPFYHASFLRVTDTSFKSSTVPGLDYWFKADGTLWRDLARSSAVNSDGQAVACWDDASGNSRNATNHVSTNRPTWKASESAINNKPYLHFNNFSGASLTNLHYLGNVSRTNWAQATGTFFIVSSSMMSNALQTIFTTTNSSGGNRASYAGGYGTGMRLVALEGAASVAAGSTYTTNWQIFTIQYSGNLSVKTNNVLAASSGTVNTGQLNGIIIGTRSLSSSPAGLYGKIAEILVYYSTMTSNDESLVYTYLKNKYFP